MTGLPLVIADFLFYGIVLAAAYVASCLIIELAIRAHDAWLDGAPTSEWETHRTPTRWSGDE